MEFASTATRTGSLQIGHAWRRLPTAVRVVLPPLLLVRIGLGLFARVSLHLFPPVSVPAVYLRGVLPVTAGIRGGLLGPWLRWDACWYLRIASVGYSPTDGTAAFFPLYPTLVRRLAPMLGDDHLLAAAAISHTACLLATLLLYPITRRELDHDRARRAKVDLLADCHYNEIGARLPGDAPSAYLMRPAAMICGMPPLWACAPGDQEVRVLNVFQPLDPNG